MSVFLQPIFTKTFSTSAGGFAFNNIPQGFQDLVMELSWRTTATDTGNFTQVVLYCNNEPFPAANHSFTQLESNGTTAYSGREAGNFIRLGYAPSANATTNTFGSIKVTIPNYTSGTFKQVTSESVTENNSSAAESVKTSLISGLYKSTLPITSLNIDTGRTNAASVTVTLYGVVNQADTVLPSAPTIGTVTDQAGLLSVAFTPASNDKADSYKVTTNPTSNTAYGTGSPIAVPVSLGTSYTARVEAVNSLGATASSSSAAITTDNNYTSIASILLGSGWGTYTFTNIPQSYSHLQLRVMSRNAGTGISNPYLNFNLDSGNNYSFHWLLGNGSSPSTGNVINGTGSWISDSPGTSTTSNCWQVSITDILYYTSLSRFKTIRSIGGYDANGSGTVSIYSGVWNSLAPISTISFTLNGSFLPNSTLSIYGIS